MKKTIFVLVITLITAGHISAVDLQLGFASGYGFPSGRDQNVVSYTADADGNYTDYRDIRASYGNGIKFDVDFTIFFNNTVGLMFCSGFSMLGGYVYEQDDPTANTSHEEGTYKANYLPITGGLKFKAEWNRLSPYLFVAPGIFIPLGVNGEMTRNNPQNVYRTTEYEYKFAPGFGISSGIGMLLELSRIFHLRFEFAPTYAFARLVEEKEIDENGDVTITIYKKNETDLPEDAGNTRYRNGADLLSFSSMAAKAGIVLEF
jgi:hypothetical protein